MHEVYISLYTCMYGIYMYIYIGYIDIYIHIYVNYLTLDASFLFIYYYCFNCLVQVIVQFSDLFVFLICIVVALDVLFLLSISIALNACASYCIYCVILFDL